MPRAASVLVVAEGFDRQWPQCRFLFCEHERDLSFRSAVDPRIRPACFPTIQVGLCLLQAFEAETFQWCLLGVADAGLDFAFAIWILDATRPGHRTVVREDVAITRI